MSSSDLTLIQDPGQLEHLLAESHARPVLLFKHSYTCGTSAFALDELRAFIAEAPRDVHYAMVAVQTHRALSSSVAATLGIRHETPQVLLLRNGQVAWHASHYRVTAEALTRALASLSPATAASR